MKNSEILEIFRTQIDSLDIEIVDLLARRFQIVEQIGELKKQDNISALQTARWNQLLENIKIQADYRWVSIELIENIWNLIHTEALKKEK